MYLVLGYSVRCQATPRKGESAPIIQFIICSGEKEWGKKSTILVHAYRSTRLFMAYRNDGSSARYSGKLLHQKSVSIGITTPEFKALAV